MNILLNFLFLMLYLKVKNDVFSLIAEYYPNMIKTVKVLICTIKPNLHF